MTHEDAPEPGGPPEEQAETPPPLRRSNAGRRAAILAGLTLGAMVVAAGGDPTMTISLGP
jgi:hypothetical protein